MAWQTGGPVRAAGMVGKRGESWPGKRAAANITLPEGNLKIGVAEKAPGRGLAVRVSQPVGRDRVSMRPPF